MLHAGLIKWLRPTARSGSTPGSLCHGLSGPAQGHFYVDPNWAKWCGTNAFHPQPHACFIQSIEDDLVNENGIMDLWVRRGCSAVDPAPAPISRHLRGDGESLSGGGRSSGLMSFLKIGDAPPGHCQAGRRGARQRWSAWISTIRISKSSSIGKSSKSRRFAAMVTGPDLCATAECRAPGLPIHGCGDAHLELDMKKNQGLREAVTAARRDMVPKRISTACLTMRSRAIPFRVL